MWIELERTLLLAGNGGTGAAGGVDGGVGALHGGDGGALADDGDVVLLDFV